MELHTVTDAAARAAAPARADAPGQREFGELAARLGAAVAAPLTAALERVEALCGGGALERGALAALREEIEAARRVGIMSQQLGRLAAAPLQLAPETLDLPAALRDALRQRAGEARRRGIELRQRLAPAVVRVDATALYALLQALLDWSFEHCRSRIELAVELQDWPAQARLRCSFAHRDADLADALPPAAAAAGRVPAADPLDTLSWQLLQRLAAALGLDCRRGGDACRVELQLSFPPPLTCAASTLALAARAGRGDVAPSVPVGCQVLVVAARGELRNQVRESLKRMALLLDFAASAGEADDYCRHGLPQAIVFEAALAGIEPLRRRLRQVQPGLAFIRLADTGAALEVAHGADDECLSVGSGGLAAALPSALAYALG